MKPAEYIENLKDVQRSLCDAKESLDSAIEKMQRFIDTGDESAERLSRQMALIGREFVIGIDSKIFDVAFAEIDY